MPGIILRLGLCARFHRLLSDWLAVLLGVANILVVGKSWVCVLILTVDTLLLFWIPILFYTICRIFSVKIRVHFLLLLLQIAVEIDIMILFFVFSINFT